MNGPEPWMKAANTDRWAEIIFKALSSRVARRWRFVSFRGTRGGEWRGVVDVLAIRKNTARPGDMALKRGDLFEIILIQIKGGSAPRPSVEEIERLRAVAGHYHAKAIVLFEWRRGNLSRFSMLDRNGEWIESTARHIFG